MTPDMGMDVNYFMVDPEPRSRSVLYPAQHSQLYTPIVHQEMEFSDPTQILQNQAQLPQTYCPLEVEIVSDLPEMPRTEWISESLYNESPNFNKDFKDTLMHAETFCDTPSMLEAQSPAKHEPTKHKKSFFSSVVSQTMPQEITIVGRVPQSATHSCGCPTNSSCGQKSFELSKAVQPKGCPLAREPLDIYLRGSGVLPELFVLPVVVMAEETNSDSVEFRWSVLASNSSKEDKLMSPCQKSKNNVKRREKISNSVASQLNTQSKSRSSRSGTKLIEGGTDCRSYDNMAI